MIHRLFPSVRLFMALLMVAGLALSLFSGTARAAGEVGSMAPNFTMTNLLAGPSTVTLSDYAGSVVCVAFFAEW